MADVFIDSNILVDLLRNYPPAITWQKSQGQSIWAITPVTWMEVIFGARDKSAQARAVSFLSQFEMVYPTSSDLAWAMENLLRFRLSHNVDVPDCLIAAPCQRLQLPLYTRNLKHFTPLLGSLAQQPY